MNCKHLRHAPLLALEKRDEKAFFVGNLAAHVGRYLQHVQSAAGVARTDYETDSKPKLRVFVYACVVNTLTQLLVALDALGLHRKLYRADAARSTRHLRSRTVFQLNCKEGGGGASET